MTSVLLEQATHTYTVNELCERCAINITLVYQFIELGVIEPKNSGEKDWQFSLDDYLRLRKAVRLQKDLDINPSGIALVLDLMDEVEALRAQVEKP